MDKLEQFNIACANHKKVRPAKPVRQTLVAIRELLSTGWCQSAAARDTSGNRIKAGDPAATSWSLVGAISKITGRFAADTPEYWIICVAVFGYDRPTTEEPLTLFNDSASSPTMILEAVDQAIRSLGYDDDLRALQSHNELLAWNLAYCSTVAGGADLDVKPLQALALPVLEEVIALAKRERALRKGGGCGPEDQG